MSLSAWQRWDALWYQQIAEHGYHAGNNTVAFYPLYPLLSRTVSLLIPPVPGNVVIAELLVSSVAFCVAMWLFLAVAKLDISPGAARLAVLLMALFPNGFFLLAPFTESLYLALSLAAFYLARRDRPWVAGGFGFMAALTRPHGVLLVLPLAFESLSHLYQQGNLRGRHLLNLLAATLPALGFLAFAVYQRVIVGEHRSALAVQQHWGYQVVPPWTAMSNSWRHVMQANDIVEAFNLICLVGFALLALWAVWRLPLMYTLYVVPYLGLLFCRQQDPPLISVSRYTLVLFPCFIIGTMWLARRPRLAAAWLVVSALVQAVFLQYFMHWGMVG